jgi:acyl transferase domain-containing protein
VSESPPPSAAADVALSPVHQAISTIRLLRERLLASERRATAPIAIIGMACRFPGADGLAAFWRVLREGVDAIGDIPADRWNVDDWYDPDPDAPAKMSARQGGFLENVADFDAEFFGISDREAVSIDPQHRLLLEVGWEALENAGLTADAVFGSKIGVFVGISSFDYASLRGRMGDPAQLDAYHAAGISHSAAAGRLAYYLGLQGPSMAPRTASSAAKVAGFWS